MRHAELLTPTRTETSPSIIAPALAALVEVVDAACTCADGTMADRIVAALKQTAAHPSLLTDGQRAAQSGCYARRLLYCDPGGHFTVVAIVWAAGQFSPIHGHHTWCAYAVHDNALEETVYAWDPANGAARPMRTQLRPPGYGCFAPAGLDQIHRLGNSGTRPAISIHVYGVERERVATHVNRVVRTA
jgi:predicted metal-dependent enzyme (double-stranded beta helix superfamily)